ncbi:MAG: right-handed parallel beta-helix repeat-containing protein [Draconibacterium sp.]
MGTTDRPVEIGMYKCSENANLPVIDARGFANGITLLNCKNIVISDLEITGNGGGVMHSGASEQNMHCGVMVTISTVGNYENIQLRNLRIHDVFFEEAGFERGKEEVRTSNGTQNYGWGIRLINQLEGAEIKNVLIENCEVTNVAHTGIKLTGRNQNITDIKLYSNRVTFSGGPGIQMSGVKNAHVQNNFVDHSGSSDDSRKWGRGSGLWTWGSSDIIIEHNSFKNANGPGDSAGCHIDFNCKNVVVQYCYSENNAGGFCEILGNNHNCAYRYNISVNDGYRTKGEKGAFQEGKIFWLSGYNGNKPRNGPFNTYFYNNTIYVASDIVAKIAVDRASSGVLIANNIFCIEGKSKAVKGDQYKPETEGQSQVENIVFKNNLYLKKGNWPADVLIRDEDPLIGNPDFKNKNGKTIADYTPQNKTIIKNMGIEINPIPGDSIGLSLGLKLEKDILGNAIKGKPDIGAIQIR